MFYAFVSERLTAQPIHRPNRITFDINVLCNRSTVSDTYNKFLATLYGLLSLNVCVRHTKTSHCALSLSASSSSSSNSFEPLLLCVLCDLFRRQQKIVSNSRSAYYYVAQKRALNISFIWSLALAIARLSVPCVCWIMCLYYVYTFLLGFFFVLPCSFSISILFRISNFNVLLSQMICSSSGCWMLSM